jgi:hypothetical protein
VGRQQQWLDRRGRGRSGWQSAQGPGAQTNSSSIYLHVYVAHKFTYAVCFLMDDHPCYACPALVSWIWPYAQCLGLDGLCVCGDRYISWQRESGQLWVHVKRGYCSQTPREAWRYCLPTYFFLSTNQIIYFFCIFLYRFSAPSFGPVTPH